MTDLNEEGLKNGLQALARVVATINARVSDAERRAAEAEADLNACRLLKGFADLQREEFRAALQRIEEAKKDAGT